MSTDQRQNVLAVSQALANLLDYVEQVGSGQTPEQVTAWCDEAEEVVLSLVAAVILADGKFDPEEQAFLELFAHTDSRPDRSFGFVRDYAERWQTLRRQVPKFFEAAVAYDAQHGTDLTHAITTEIQLAGNNAAVTDRRFSDSENAVVREYLKCLDDYLEPTPPDPQML